MKRVQTFNDFHKIASEWNPELTYVNSVEEAADHINFPHEDYPQFVNSTLETMKEVINWLKEGDLTERDIKMVHQMCMKDKEYLRLGDYRMTDVMVGDELVPPQPYMIPPLMMSICPVGVEYQTNEESILKWYKEFETIHPFEDGNGRVGGIILSALTYLNGGKFLVPSREYRYTIEPIIDRITNEEDTLLNNENYFDQEVPYEERCIYYIYSLLNSDKFPKFRKVLEETDTLDEITLLVNDGNIDGIIYILDKLI